jgi:hypothetical protein
VDRRGAEGALLTDDGSIAITVTPCSGPYLLLRFLDEFVR